MSAVVATRMCWPIYLQPALYSNNELWSRLGQPGVAVGLAWTTVGGEVLLVEANKMEGDGELVLTGHLGDVMKESARLALNWVRTSARQVRRTQVSFLLPASSDISRLYFHKRCRLFPLFCSMACR
jgi:ATP-dependent Lon protease